MAALRVPSKGLALRHESNDSVKDTPTQVIRLDLMETATQDILRTLKHNEPVRLRGGKKPILQIGKKSITLDTNTTPFPSEVYENDHQNENTLYFSGKLSHTLEVQKAEKDTAGSDEALVALESTLKSLQELKASNETSIIGNKEGVRGRKDNKVSPMLGQNASRRNDHLLGGLGRSTPSSPFLSASYSPRQGPTSAPLASGISVQDQVRLDAIRIPLIHLLAIRPLTSRGVAEKLRAPRDDVEKILEKVARDTKVGDGRKELKEKSYRELNVFKFNYRTTDDRQSAIANAITAYDRTRVDKKDNLWQLLLPEEERGKGKWLSKLNFEKPVQVPSHATPRPGEDGNESKAETSDRESNKAKAKKDTVTVQKKSREKAAISKASAKPETTLSSRSKDSQSKQSRPDGKYKSSERIEDSDEEADTADEPITKPTVKTIAKAPSNVKRRTEQEQHKSSTPSHTIPSPNKAIHKTSLSSSSSSSGNDKPRTLANEPPKGLKAQPKTDFASASRISPRPRHDSSPQKPSPLGSSPPTTSTDVENSSSSKASNQSSAPSSPPSSLDMPQAKHKNGNKYSPIIASDKSGNASRGRSPVRQKAEVIEEGRAIKRKAEATTGIDERPLKRQQQNPAPAQTHVKALSNGVTPTASAILQRPVPPARQNSDTISSRSSSPDKPALKREDVIDDARRFQKYYRRYKDLYDRISSVEEKDRDDKDMLDLWKMHKRLKEMKADIWGNWDRIEKVGKVSNKVDKVMRQAVAVA